MTPETGIRTPEYAGIAPDGLLWRLGGAFGAPLSVFPGERDAAKVKNLAYGPNRPCPCLPALVRARVCVRSGRVRAGSALAVGVGSLGSSGAVFPEWSRFLLSENAWQAHASLFQWVSRSRATHAIGRHSGAMISSMISRGSADLPTKPPGTAFSCVCARGSGCACARVRTHTHECMNMNMNNQNIYIVIMVGRSA